MSARMDGLVLLQAQGESLWARFSASHGYLNKQGYCDGGNTLGSPSGNCHLFPVIWGETGTGFTVSHQQQSVLWHRLWMSITPACINNSSVARAVSFTL